MERSINLNNDSFELSIPEEKSNKLTIIFKSASPRLKKPFCFKKLNGTSKKQSNFTAMVATSDKRTNSLNIKMKMLVDKEIAVLGPVQKKTAERMRKR